MFNRFFSAPRPTAVIGILQLLLWAAVAQASTITIDLAGQAYASQTGVLSVQRDMFRNGGWGYRWVSPADASGYSIAYAPLVFSLANIVPVNSTIDSATLEYFFSGLSANTDWQRPDPNT